MIKLEIYLESKKIDAIFWNKVKDLRPPREEDLMEPFDKILISEIKVELKQQAVRLLKADQTLKSVRGICKWKDATISDPSSGEFEVEVKREDLITPQETYLTEIGSTTNLLKKPAEDVVLVQPEKRSKLDDIYGGLF